MIPEIIGAQRDFSSGEINVALKRSDDHPARKTGLRQMANMRILNSTSVQNRPGKTALFPITFGCTRVEEFTIAPGVNFKIELGVGRLQFINSAGVTINSFGGQANGT